MNNDKLIQETRFGLENLGRVHERIAHILALPLDEAVLVSALAYEGLGYYNAIEHLMLRFIKHLKLPRPEGASSHRDTLRAFIKITEMYNILCDEQLWGIIQELMAFRHVMTKIYGFLIDLDKLKDVIEKIQRVHEQIVDLFERSLQALPND